MTATDYEKEEFEGMLSFVTLKDDNLTMLLNGEPGYPVALPKYIHVKKKREDKLRIVDKKILDGCHMYNLDYVSEQNVAKLSKEIVGLLYERANAVEATEQEEEQEQQPTVEQQPEAPKMIELTPDLIKEISWNETSNILSISIKKDRAPKLITFSGMLLAQTNRDEMNIGFQSESSTGKSYIPFEIASYFPPNEVLKIASASPTAFFHRAGKWDEERKAQVCDLENKIVIFSDQPHFQLLEKMRSVLSKDDKELTYWITDKSRSGANRTKTIIIRGFASFFFCTAKADVDEQEKTRLILLSPETDETKLYESLELAALRNADTDEYRSMIEQDPKRKWLIDRVLAIRQLDIKEIIIPDKGKPVFERFIKEHKYLIARHQRDLPRIFGFIKAHALLNAFNRERLTNGKSGTMIATDADIEAGFALYREIEESNELGLSPFIYRIYNDVIKPELNTDGITRKDIRSKYFNVFHKFLHPKFEDAVITQIEATGLIQLEPDPTDKRKMLILPPSRDRNDVTEDEKYIPHDSGYTPKKPTFQTFSDKTGKTESEGGVLGVLDPFVENVENIKDFAAVPTVAGDISPSSQVSPIALDMEKVIQKCMRDEQGNKKGYFTANDFIYTLVMRPNEHWSEDQAEQTLYALVEEGKLTEFEEARFKPTI